MIFIGKYWVGQKFHLGFPITSYGTTPTNFLANSINTNILGVLAQKLWVYNQKRLEI